MEGNREENFPKPDELQYDLVMVVTCINDNYIMKMINSVIKNNDSIFILVLFINQSDLVFEFTSLNAFVSIETIVSCKISSSKARNLGIKYLLERNIKFAHIMFPDDDSTFPEIFFEKYREQIFGNINYLIAVYCDGTKKNYKKNKYSHGEVLGRYNYNAALSVALIINYKTFTKVGFLDERMGVGAKYGAGEDADYYIRACDIYIQGFIYNTMIYNYHPSTSKKFSKMTLSQTIKKYVNYGNGVIYLLCKHKMYFKALSTCVRSIGGVIISFIKLDFNLFIAYGIVFFTRLLMFLKCLIFPKKLYKNV